MPSFRFEAADGAGRIEKGLVEADSAAAARAALRARGLVPLGVATLDAQPVRAFRRRRFSEAELALATRQLASLLTAGLPIAQALGATIEQADDHGLREVLAAVRSTSSPATASPRRWDSSRASSPRSTARAWPRARIRVSSPVSWSA